MIELPVLWVLLLVPAGIGAIVLLLHWQARKERERMALLAEEAVRRGWQWERLGPGFRMRGFLEGGAPWVLEMTRRHSGDTPRSYYTTWQTAAVSLPSGLVLACPMRGLGPSLPERIDAGGWALKLLTALLRSTLGPDAGRIHGLSQAPLGGPGFRARYTVLAHEPAAAARLLTPAVQEALLELPAEQTCLVRLGGALWVELPSERLTSIAQISQVVALGARLVAGWAASA